MTQSARIIAVRCLMLTTPLLVGCASMERDIDGRTLAMQPVMTADCADNVEVRVRFIRHRSAASLAGAYERACQSEGDTTCSANAAHMKDNGQQALAFSINRPGGTGELHYLAPKDFNDWYRLALVGHEAMHLCGARHESAVASLRDHSRDDSRDAMRKR